MQRPSWTKIVGILMILFAGCGVTQDIKQINSKALSEFSIDMAEEMSAEMDEEEISEEEAEIFRKLSKAEGKESEIDSTISGESLGNILRDMTYLGPTAISKMELHGKLGLGFSIIYALAGLFFLIKPKVSLKMIFGVLIVSILFAVYQLIDSKDLDASFIMKKGLDINLYFGIFGDVILLIIMAVSDKSYFSENVFGEDYYDSP